MVPIPLLPDRCECGIRCGRQNIVAEESAIDEAAEGSAGKATLPPIPIFHEQFSTSDRSLVRCVCWC